jgi:energy-coupling factor transport system ATP-binding protein
VGVLGANESGKSTLCLLGAGLAPATIGGTLTGRVSVDGLDTASARAHELALRCGVLFQNPATQLSGTAATVWEEIAFGPRNLRLPLADVAARVDEALALLGIERLAAREPARLSGGESQLVALAGVLALRPAYLLLDEPTSQLDPAGTELVSDAIAGLARATGAGILLTEHKTDVVARVAGRAAVLAGGRVVLDGPAAPVLNDATLEELGVRPPTHARLARAVEHAGMQLPSAAGGA